MTHRGLVVFDLDGTLLRPATACEIIAEPLGRLDEMHAFEQLKTKEDIAHARRTMADWYGSVGTASLSAAIGVEHFAPGAVEGIRKLQAAGLEVALASVTWDFAVEACARLLGIQRWLATRLHDAEITHCWPEHKADWATEQREQLGFPPELLAAVGDSAGDIPLLNSAKLSIYVGSTMPTGLDGGTIHLPGAAIDAVADVVLSRWRQEGLGL